MTAQISAEKPRYYCLFDILRGAKLENEPYVSQSLLSKRGVRVGTLQLRPAAGSQSASGLALQPLEPEELECLLDNGKIPREQLEPVQDSHSWSGSGSDSEDRDEARSANENHSKIGWKRYYNSVVLFNHMDRYLSASNILQKTGWHLHDPKLTHLEKFDGSGRRRYQVQYLGECRSAATGALIKDKPYVTAYLLDQTPLQEGRVLFSEINTIMYLAARIDMESEFQGRDSYMVTVVTGSDLQIRITQAFVDLAKEKVEIKMSEALDFGSGAMANWEDWRAVLCWFCATPAPQ